MLDAYQQIKDKEDVVCTHNVILFGHKEEWILSFASKWMELENMMLSKRSQTQKDKHHIFSLLYGSLKSQPTWM
jgi:hypothetical protein